MHTVAGVAKSKSVRPKETSQTDLKTPAFRPGKKQKAENRKLIFGGVAALWSAGVILPPFRAAKPCFAVNKAAV